MKLRQLLGSRYGEIPQYEAPLDENDYEDPDALNKSVAAKGTNEYEYMGASTTRAPASAPPRPGHTRAHTRAIALVLEDVGVGYLREDRSVPMPMPMSCRALDLCAHACADGVRFRRASGRYFNTHWGTAVPLLLMSWCLCRPPTNT